MLAIEKVTDVVSPETPETILEKAKQYVKSRWPFGQVPEDEEAFFAFALARMTQARIDPMDPEVAVNSKKDYDEWVSMNVLPWYIVTWRELSRADLMHGKG